MDNRYDGLIGMDLISQLNASICFKNRILKINDINILIIQNATDLEVRLTITTPFKVTNFSEECIVNNTTGLTDIDINSVLTANLQKLRFDHLN